MTIVAAGMGIGMRQSGGVSSHPAVEESEMEWLVVTSLAVLVVSLAIVVYEATNDTRR